MENTKGRNLVIGVLLAAVVIMAVGYAALAQTLQINGTATISSNWDVAITDITEGTPTGGAANRTPASHTGTTATFDVTLNQPGDTMTYVVTVHNGGTLNAKLTGLTVTPEESEVEGIYFDVTGVEQNVTTLDAGEDNQITVVVGWRQTGTDMPEELSQTLTVSLTYEQY